MLTQETQLGSLTASPSLAVSSLNVTGNLVTFPIPAELRETVASNWHRVEEAFRRIPAMFDKSTSEFTSFSQHVAAVLSLWKNVIDLMLNHYEVLQGADWVPLAEVLYRTHQSHMTDELAKTLAEAKRGLDEFKHDFDAAIKKIEQKTQDHSLSDDKRRNLSVALVKLRTNWEEAECALFDTRALARNFRNLVENEIDRRIIQHNGRQKNDKELAASLFRYLDASDRNDPLLSQALSILSKVREELGSGDTTSHGSKSGTRQGSVITAHSNGSSRSDLKSKHSRELDTFEQALQRRFQEASSGQYEHFPESEQTRIEHAAILGFVAIQSHVLSKPLDTEVAGTHQHIFLTAAFHVLEQLKGEHRKALGKFFALQAVAMGLRPPGEGQ